ncbi:MAG: lamin tail domain-containing protein, partial [Candidatus Promineifilaceae bacterium]
MGLNGAVDVRIDMRIDGGNRIGWLLAAAIGSLLAVCFIVRYPQTVQSSAVTFEIIISEVAWSGTDASSTDEWLELHNNSAQPVSLEGWSLVIDGVEISLAGSVAPNGYFLLERNDDQTVSDIPADQIYTGLLANTGVSITLVSATGALIDSANVDEGPWPGGTASPDFRSMERIHPYAPDFDSNWISNDAITINGIDAFGNPINGTPGKANSSWADLPPEADLTISKSGPATVYAGTLVPYEITLNNTGQISADNVLLTDTLPTGFGYVNDNSGLPISQTSTNTLVWQIGILSVDDPRTFILTASVPSDAAGIYINHVAASSSTTETITYNNMDDASTNVITPSTPLVLIDAVYYDGYETNEPDEAVRIINVGDSSADLEGWSLTDGAASSAFPENVFLEPGEAIWISRGGEDFYRQFGFRPDFESQDTSSEIADMEGAWPGFSNAGDEVILLNRFGQIQDAVVYENGDATHPGWSGPAVQPYLVPGIFGAEGQILFRKRSPDTYLPIADTNTAADWAQDYSDVESGRRVQYPGWDIDKHLRPLYLTETTTVEIAIAPDNSYEFLKREILGAQESVRIASYTFRSFTLTIDLVEALSRGVSVTVLLEGGPAGGIDEQEKN